MTGTEGRTPATALLARTPVVDGHNDLPWAMRKHGYDFAVANPIEPLDGVHTDLPRLRAGGVGGQFWSVYVPSTLAGGDAVSATLEQIAFVHELVRRAAGDLQLVTTAAGVEEATANGRIASLLGAEGGHSIDCSMPVLRMLHELGVRYLTLTHNDHVPWADSATDDGPGVGGLSAFGREVVGEMNRLGMLVDLSHVAPATMRAALETSDAPVIFSHSSARAVCDHPRNVPDDVLASLVTNGGVCMATFVPVFVSPAVRAWDLELQEALRAAGFDPRDWEATRQFRRDYAARVGRPEATVEDVVAHFEHLRAVVGVDHIGVGGDYDGVDRLPVGLEDVSCYPALFDALLARGWSEDDCAKVARGNVLRVFHDAEEVAARLRETRDPSVARLADLDGG